MANPLFEQMGGMNNMGPMGQIMQQFQQFKANFRGDPQQEVQRMLNSGQITQEQYNSVQQTASQLMRMLGR